MTLNLVLCTIFISELLFISADVTQFSLHIEPSHGHLSPGQNLTLMCRAPVPLTHCQILVSSNEPYDASQGLDSTPQRGHSYRGRGLEYGECGFYLQGDVVFSRNGSGYPVTCRVRSVSSDWTYAIMAVDKHIHRHVGLSVEERLRIVSPGSQVQVLYKVNSSFSTCKLRVESWRSSRQHNLITGGCTANGNLCALGDKRDRQECGYVIKNASLEFSGLLWMEVLGDNGHRLTIDFLMLLVAVPPSESTLTMNLATNADGYRKLTAECVVKSCPASNITWFLGDDPLEDAQVSYVHSDTWGKITGQRTTRQRLTKYLDYRDEGKELWCRADHFLLPDGLQSNRIRIEGSQIQNRSCAPLKSDTVKIDCFLGTIKKNCEYPQSVGTTARLQCKPGYAIPSHVFYREIYCLESLQWNRDLFTCFPDCGRRKSNTGVGLISNGVSAVVGEFPWHVAVYRKYGGEFKQECGGSLISPRVVITAAHCFWNFTINVANSAQEFRVVAGKFRRAWEDNEPMIQHREITRIDTNLFNGVQRNFAYDIALVHLKQSIEITDAVNIVCVDWDGLVELVHLQPGNMCTVPGWGFTETGELSDTLKYIDLPYIPKDRCYAALAPTEQPVLTNDKFCAGYQNQSKSVCPGDSGGGLVFLEKSTKQYYLRGIVSLAFKPAGHPPTNCYSEQYTAFTSLSRDYIRWIQRVT